MKLKIVILSLLGLIFFNSCSSDSNSSNQTSQNLDPNTILPKKVIIDNYSGSTIYEIFYDQNKINYIKCVLEDNNQLIEFKINFIYNGNLISQITFIDMSTGNVLDDEVFTYQNNQLIQIGSTQDGVLYNYMYNSNGVITETSPNSQDTTTYTISNGLVVSYIGNATNQTLSYYNNSSYSPYKNILGIDKIYFIPNRSFLSDLFLFPKNIRSIRGSFTYRYTYTYNNILFPTSFIKERSVFNYYQMEENYNIIY
jgi:hypothetical protein